MATLPNIIDGIIPSLDTSASYTAGDVLFTDVEVKGVSTLPGAIVSLVGVTLVDLDDNTAADITLILTANKITFGTKNSAPSISDAELTKDRESIMSGIQIVIASTDFIDYGGSKVAMIPPNSPKLGGIMKLNEGSKNLYAYAICSGTPTHTVSGIRLKLTFWQY